MVMRKYGTPLKDWLAITQTDVIPSFSDPDKISNLLADSVHEAHTRTSLMPREQIREEWKKGIDRNMIFNLKNMVRRNMQLM